MLNQTTLTTLKSLKLNGMATALEEQLATTSSGALAFEERLALIVDREVALREDRRLTRLLQMAKLKHNACVEDIDYGTRRGLEKARMASLASGEWLRAHQNLAITGPTGCGKTWLACALGNQACRLGFSVLYVRVPRLFEELNISKGDGRFARRLSALARTDLLILDDWGLHPLDASARHDLLEILDDRVNARSTLITSQLPIEHWHATIGEPTLADAILDRLLHNAHKLPLKGESMRKRTAALTQRDHPMT